MHTWRHSLKRLYSYICTVLRYKNINSLVNDEQHKVYLYFFMSEPFLILHNFITEL